MANKFKVNQLLLTNNTVTTTGNNIYVNGLGAYTNNNPQNYATSGDLSNVSGILSARLNATGASLISLISASSAGVSTLNGQSGAINLTGAGDVSILVNGQNITISGNTGNLAGYATVNNLQSSGQNLYTLLVNESGSLQSQINSQSNIHNSITGFGNATYIPKFNLDNSGISNSSIVDSGSIIYFNNNYISSSGSNNLYILNSGITGIILSGNNVNIAAANLNIGLLNFQTNAGSVVAFELPVLSGSPISGAEQSYTFNVSGNPIAKIYAEYDGANSIQNPSFNIIRALHLFPSGINLNNFVLGHRPFYINNATGINTWILPPISISTGRSYLIKNKGNTLTLTGNSANEKIYSTSRLLILTINSGEGYHIINDGIDWSVL